MMAPGQRILVVEDNPEIRETICELLREEGYDVAAAANGELAWSQLLADRRPDVIVLDLMMPVLDGMGFRDRQVQSRFASIPVVIVSANLSVGPELLPGGRLAGCAYVTKPFAVARLLDEIERCLAVAAAND